MPVGIFINALSVAIGGVVGALFGHKLPTRINSELTKIFGVCSMGMGVSSIGLMKNMPAVIFAVIIGTAFGLAVNLGGIINHGAACMVSRFAQNVTEPLQSPVFYAKFYTFFCIWHEKRFTF